MGEPKKQHYVPQTYLKGFSFSNKRPYKIFTLHKDKGKKLQVNISDAAAERHFYTIKKSNDKYYWEKLYAEKIEPLMSNVLTEIISKCDNVLIQNNSFVLTSEIKQQLAITIVCQLLRGKQSREFQHKIYSEVVPPIIKETQEQLAPINGLKEKILKDVIQDDDYFKSISMEATFDIKRLEKYSNILMQRNFLVYK